MASGAYDSFLKDAGIAPSEMHDARLAAAADRVTLAVAELSTLLAQPGAPTPSRESALRVMEAVTAARRMDSAATEATAVLAHDDNFNGGGSAVVTFESSAGGTGASTTPRRRSPPAPPSRAAAGASAPAPGPTPAPRPTAAAAASVAALGSERRQPSALKVQAAITAQHSIEQDQTIYSSGMQQWRERLAKDLPPTPKRSGSGGVYGSPADGAPHGSPALAAQQSEHVRAKAATLRAFHSARFDHFRHQHAPAHERFDSGSVHRLKGQLAQNPRLERKQTQAVKAAVDAAQEEAEANGVHFTRENIAAVAQQAKQHFAAQQNQTKEPANMAIFKVNPQSKRAPSDRGENKVVRDRLMAPDVRLSEVCKEMYKQVGC